MNEYYLDEAIKNFIYLIAKGNDIPIDIKSITISADIKHRLRDVAIIYIRENEDQ